MTREPFEHVRLRSFLLWIVVTSAVLGIGLAAYRYSSSQPLSDLGITAIAALFYASLAFWAFGEVQQARVPLKLLLAKGAGGLGPVRIGALLSACLLFGVSSFRLFGYISGESAVDPLVAKWHGGGEPSLLALGGLFVVAVVVAPIVEEVIFRGLILRSWAYRYSLNKAIVVPALVFASIHFENFPGAFVLGLIYAVLYLRTRSLWLPITLHGLNTITLSISEFGFEGAEPQVRISVTLVMLLWSSIYLGRFLYREWPKADPEPSGGGNAVTL